MNNVFVCQWECTSEYLGDPSMPVGFDPSRINPHIIKNSLADRRPVLSGENAVCIGYSSDNLAAKGHVKGKRLTGELK